MAPGRGFELRRAETPAFPRARESRMHQIRTYRRIYGVGGLRMAVIKKT